MASDYDAILIVGFGGPERPEDVMPFLENVTRGRNVPRERLLEVAEHYHHFGGLSPINAQVRELIGVMRTELNRSGVLLPIYWGNRNWHPMLADTLAEMTASGVKRALAVCSGSIQLLFELPSVSRRHRAGRGKPCWANSLPRVEKVRVFYNHPEFISANAERVREAAGLDVL